MKSAITYIAVLIAFVVLSPHSYSQTNDNVLEGVPSVKIVVEDLRDDARICGFTKDDLRSAASFPLATSRLQICEISAITFYIQVNVLSEASGCSAAYRIEVYDFQSVVVAASNQRKSAAVELWENGGLVVGPTNTFGNQVRASIERLTKEFVVDRTLDQQ